MTTEDYWRDALRALDAARGRLESKSGDDRADHEAVGVHCRAALESVAKAVYDEGRHGAFQPHASSGSNAKSKLELFFGAELSGSALEDYRQLAKKAIRLASTVVHSRPEDERLALVLLAATTSVVHIAGAVSGLRTKRTAAADRAPNEIRDQVAYPKQRLHQEEFRVRCFKSLALMAVDRAEHHLSGRMTADELERWLQELRRAAEQEDCDDYSLPVDYPGP